MIYEVHAKKRPLNGKGHQFEYISKFYDINMLYTAIDNVNNDLYKEVMVLQKENETEEGTLIYYQELDLPNIYKKKK